MRPRIIERLSVTLDVVVRTCEERDLTPLEWFGSFTAHRAFIRAQFERHLRGGNIMLVADRMGYPVGQIWIDLEKHVVERVALLWALRVIAPLQNVGIGRHLILAAEAVARAAGFRIAEMGVEKDNERARHLYERLGYAYVRDEVSEEPYVSPNGIASRHVFDQWILQKPLASRLGG